MKIWNKTQMQTRLSQKVLSIKSGISRMTLAAFYLPHGHIACGFNIVVPQYLLDYSNVATFSDHDRGRGMTRKAMDSTRLRYTSLTIYNE